ncbi:MAG: DUF4279 domain-containing protein [Planctomycetaceae bacterium]|nr:DUF4279 domain-containing protein [Planctomycetaceae bacterium]
MATYKSEMLSFGYTATLHIRHPPQSLASLTERLGLAPSQTHNAGDARTTPNGMVLNEHYPEHYWSCDLKTEDQHDITEFLRKIVSEFEPNRQFLCAIAETGGVVCVFIGVGNSHCCAHQFDRHLLFDLAATGIDLRIDFYGGELPQRGLHPCVENKA